jgi:hypothetical protein
MAGRKSLRSRVYLESLFESEVENNGQVEEYLRDQYRRHQSQVVFATSFIQLFPS